MAGAGELLPSRLICSKLAAKPAPPAHPLVCLQYYAAVVLQGQKREDGQWYYIHYDGGGAVPCMVQEGWLGKGTSVVPSQPAPAPLPLAAAAYH